MFSKEFLRSSMMARRPPIQTIIITGFAFIAALVLLSSITHRRYVTKSTNGIFTASGASFKAKGPIRDAGNATLGFTKILALSSGTSWRTHGLSAAAQLTGLEIDIPLHPNAPDELVTAFAGIGSSPDSTHPNRGAARAWLAHLDLIRYFIASNLETVLIVEDDVDWDYLALKEQMQLIASKVREFTQVPSSSTPFSSHEEKAPYGLNWDVFWPGHCGEMLHNDTQRLEFEDTTAGKPQAWSQYAGWSKFSMHHISEGHRAVQHAIMPVCTFGYALNKYTAEKVLQRTSKGQDEAFDVVLNHACAAGELNCIVVNPEVMHHYKPPEGYYGSSSDVYTANEGGDDGEASALRQHEQEEAEKKMGETANIVHSARCQALFNSTCPAPPSDDSLNAGFSDR